MTSFTNFYCYDAKDNSIFLGFDNDRCDLQSVAFAMIFVYTKKKFKIPFKINYACCNIVLKLYIVMIIGNQSFKV